MTALDQARPTIDFGVVNLNDTLPKKHIGLNSHGIEKFKISSILAAPVWVDASLDTDSRGLSVQIKDERGMGFIMSISSNWRPTNR